ncbi:hypothetical protein GN244_ATG03277 [Phytophthora infestans]|uniref:Uncharacterized protein n=1 Tax=Phytophthora infestans TaxID=4787 RepID=A0A833SQJ0_PHYIN|nr:hypothetical protein GN244_ATG03277 [Phytophthora infestans]
MRRPGTGLCTCCSKNGAITTQYSAMVATPQLTSLASKNPMRVKLSAVTLKLLTMTYGMSMVAWIDSCVFVGEVANHRVTCLAECDSSLNLHTITAFKWKLQALSRVDRSDQSDSLSLSESPRLDTFACVTEKHTFDTVLRSGSHHLPHGGDDRR